MSEHDEYWYRLELLVEADRAEDAASMLWELDAAGVEVQDRETYTDDGLIPPVPEGTCRLVAFFQRPSPDEGASEAAIVEREVVASLSDADIDPSFVSCALYTDTSWKTAWKAYFKPTLMSPRAIVGPPWEEFEAPEGGTKIVIEPGMAFGTGTHETTQLCSEKIDRLLAESETPPSVLDVGCGSAILSMIARRLGAETVVGIDVDETAVEVARENLRVNNLDQEIDLSTTAVGEVEGTFDIVVANILTHILLHLREDLFARVAPGGILLLSGITDEQVDEIREAFVGDGFAEVSLDQKGDWVCFELREDL
jgi:ribosomal protein L11 methyltransferase